MVVKQRIELNFEYFNELFMVKEKPKDYNGEWSGLVRKTEWRSGKNYSIVKALIGDMAGSISTDNRDGRKSWKVKVSNRLYHAHRIIWLLLNGRIEDTLMVDHVNGNSLDNSAENLRLVNACVNNRNQKQRMDNSTGVTGVHWCTKAENCVYAVASWRNEIGKICTKSFSVKKYGTENAFQLACTYRKDKIDSLNKNLGSMSYTQRHGNPTKEYND